MLIRFACVMFVMTSVISCDTITVNGKDIRKILKPGAQVFSYEISNNANNIGFYFKNGNLQLGSVTLASPIEKVHQYYENMQKNQHQLSQFNCGKILNLNAGISTTHSGTCLSAGEKIVLKAGQVVNIESSLLKSPQIIIGAREFRFSECCVNGDILQLECTDEKGIFAVMRFTFANSTTRLIHGNINMSTGQMDEHFVVFGAVKLEIQFNSAVLQ